MQSASKSIRSIVPAQGHTPKIKRTRYCFGNAGLEEQILAVVIARMLGISPIAAWRRYVDLEDPPQCFHDFAHRANKEAKKFMEEKSALAAKVRT
jgi:hypothetical protein